MNAVVVSQTPPTSPNPTRRRAGAAIAAAGVIAAGAVTPPWLGWVPTLVAFSMPGATFWWVLRAGDRGRPGGDPAAPPTWVRTAALSVMLSTAIVILVAVALDGAGVSIDRASVALSLAAVQMALAAASLVRGEPAREVAVRVPRRLVAGAVVAVVGAASLVATIVGVHALAPAAPTMPYARISWAAASPTGIQPVGAGLVDATVSVEAVGAAESVQLQESLDGGMVAPPVTVVLRPGVPADITLPATYPRLDGCPHRVQVTLSAAGGGGDVSVTRYVRGAGAGGCRGAS